MANGNGNDETGSKDRTTVALVGAEVREVKLIVQAHADLTAEKLNAIKEKIEPLTDLPERVARLEEKVEHLEGDVDEAGQHKEKRSDWKRGAMTTAAFAFTGTIVNLAINFHWFGLHA